MVSEALSESAHTGATPSGSPPLAGASLVRVIHDPIALDFAVKAKIYPEDPGSMFVTTRGGGLSVYDLSIPDRPRLRARWNDVHDVEGQDREGDLLVVVARIGELHSFDVSDPDAPRHLGRIALGVDPSVVKSITGRVLDTLGKPFHALHTKLHRLSDGRLVALVTAPVSQELVAVDVSDPERPVQLGSVDTQIQFIEGISVHRGHAFLGGFGRSDVYRAVDVSDPAAMRVVASLSNRLYRQMVSEMSPQHPDRLYAALWDEPGGLGVFDVEDPRGFHALGSIVRPELAWANRVKLIDDLAFLPLEQEPGGFAAIDVSEATAPGLVGIVREIPDVSVPYTLAVNGDHLYIFGTREATMAVFALARGEPELGFARWNFGPGDDEAITKGRAADAGRGSLRYLDARAGGAASTRAQVAAVADPEKAYLEIVPREPWTRENGLVLEHELTQTFHGTLPAYTIVWDIQVPTESFEANGCFARNPTGCNEVPLYQLDRRNREDAELFLKLGTMHRSRHGFIGNVGSLLQRRGGLGGYADAIEPDRWHRVAIVVDLRRETGHASIYVDGRLVHETERIDYERYTSVSEGDPDADVPVRDGFLLFADDDGEMNAPVRLASLLFVNRAYGADEVAALGAPGPEGIPAP